MSEINESIELFENGYMCSQAVFAAFSPQLGVDKDKALKIGACFGSGMRKGEVCGACTGALMVLGLKYGESKDKSNEVCKTFLDEFKNENGDYIWFEQKNVDGTDFVVDNEDGYSHIKEIDTYEVYYRYTDKNHIYVWNDGKYSMCIKSTTELPNLEIIAIIEGLTIK